jgi:hypothetical protein
MILRSYNDMISIDWWESHDVILNDEMKQWSWTDVEGQRTVIVGRKWGVSMRFTSSLQQKKSLRRHAIYRKSWH